MKDSGDVNSVPALVDMPKSVLPQFLYKFPRNRKPSTYLNGTCGIDQDDYALWDHIKGQLPKILNFIKVFNQRRGGRGNDDGDE